VLQAHSLRITQRARKIILYHEHWLLIISSGQSTQTHTHIALFPIIHVSNFVLLCPHWAVNSRSCDRSIRYPKFMAISKKVGSLQFEFSRPNSNRTSWPKRKRLWLVFGRWPVWNSTDWPFTLIEVFIVFLSTLGKCGIVPWISPPPLLSPSFSIDYWPLYNSTPYRA
jgi:hypothetical protein